MQKVVLLIVGATWLVGLLPPLLRARGESRPTSSVDHFRRNLAVLQQTAPPRINPLQSLGRPLSGGVQTITVPLVAPQTLFEARISRLDLRLSKSFKVQRLRIQANVDAYNVLNANPVRSVNSVYGGNWTRPTQILDARLVQFGGQVSF